MINFKKLELSDHEYTRIYNDTKFHYDVPNLIQFAKEKGYKTFTLDLQGIDLSKLMWHIENMKDITYHMKRVLDSDLSIPILIDDQGCICDGWHRVVKAIISGIDNIEAIRFEEMPFASREEKIS
jgi:hypothetical protein